MAFDVSGLSLPLLIAALAAGFACALLIVTLRPLLVRYALARPNGRSSHTIPTPQGGGIAVLAGIWIGASIAIALGGTGQWREAAMVGMAAILLAVVGAYDDIRPMPVLPRLGLQALCVIAVLTAVGSEARLLPALPLAVERGLEMLAGIWFVNLVNFMDGLDWMSVAEAVPVAAALALFGQAGLVAPDIALVAAALAGAMLGFAPFNRPVARLFLGDVGSLPLGLLLAWLLYRLAVEGPLVAALLLPLYYVCDATITLIRRLARGEKVWQAHRSHFYQRATDHGLSVRAVVGRVFVLNLALAALAASSFLWRTPEAQVALLIMGLAAVGLVLRDFATPRAQKVAA
jgi:UDP-N-acetylmuramyl pentapeptide phosphotransferase/UDP-N-acetylglucosamine-1-phosphate transferase